jgi:hypothetical protein
MKRILVLTVSMLAVDLFAAQLVHAASDADLIKSAESAAPASVASGAAIYVVGAVA